MASVSASGAASVSGLEAAAEDCRTGHDSARGHAPSHAHLKRPLVNPLKLRTDAAAYPNGPLCALVEIAGDNPADAGASAVTIDDLPAVTRGQFDTGPRLRIVDDGCSMNATQLHHAVSHGFTTRKKGRLGMYGYGLQVGAFCNGDALLMGCKTREGVHAALLSLHYLDEMGIPEVKLATASWERTEAGGVDTYTLQQGGARSEERLELDESLFVLQHFSPYESAADLLAAVLDAVRTPTGTMQELFHLHTTADGTPLLRFDVPGDLLLRPGVSRTHTNLPAEQGPPALDTSLRAYLEVLYLTPRLRITLRGAPVVHRSLAAGLWHPHDAPAYSPRAAGVKVYLKLGVMVEADEATAPAGGAVADACARLSRRGGVALYWRGRLIRFCEPLGMQRSSNSLMGAGICGVADVGDLLTPVPTKQAFEQDEHHMRLLKELGDRLNSYISELVVAEVLDPDLQHRRLTDAAAGVLAAVRAQEALGAAVAADPRRALQCADCRKHRFLDESVDDDEFEELADAEWRCDMHPDADAAAAGCAAPQEAPQEAQGAGALHAVEAPAPDWLLAYGVAAEGWRMELRLRSTDQKRIDKHYTSPSGQRFRSRVEVERHLAGVSQYSRRLTAAEAPTKKRGAKSKVPNKRKKTIDSDDDEEEEDEEAAAAPKRPRKQTLIKELAFVQKQREKANRELAAQHRALAAEKEKLEAARRALERDKRAEAQRRHSERTAAPQPQPQGDVRVCRCRRTVAECGAQLTVVCVQCHVPFHAECLGLAHDVAERGIACADHADAAVEGRRAAALLKPDPRTARRGGGPQPAPSASDSLFQLFPGTVGDDAASGGDGLPANWPRAAGSPAFLTSNVYGAWPTPEQWALLHATHQHTPLAGVEIRRLPLSHRLAKAAIGTKGSKPRGLFATHGFPADAVIGQYVGHVRYATSMDCGAQYVFELGSVATPDGRKVLIDAGPCGNEMRFINDHSRLAPKPNCVFKEVRVMRGAGSELVVQVLAKRRILRDEELLLDYGDKYWSRADASDDDEG